MQGRGRQGKKDHERGGVDDDVMLNEGNDDAANVEGESVESLEPDGGRKGKKRMKGSEKEGGEDEEVGSEGENEVEVEMEEIEGGGEAEEVGNEGENEVEVEMGEGEEVKK
ncbi:hypothetical protein CesoFtcFv8_014544 [Champsocephalus esox]|uniref:Uncharacterized protein n=1 Tax=Champsocephalus esox TaxID=159716 RepID=A0AAN8BQS0_9TELE|nr:hypothetical protein CesoFtcFv8_014544 [Champsocephalus esox]